MGLMEQADIGRPLAPARTHWDEGLRVHLHTAHVQVRLVVPGDSHAHSLAAAVEGGYLHFAWTHSGSVAVMAARLTDAAGVEHLPWRAVPYTVRDNAHDGLSPLAAAPGTGEPLPATIAVIDATGRTLAGRDEEWPAVVADEIRATVDAYHAQPDGIDTHATLSELWAEYRTPPAPASPETGPTPPSALAPRVEALPGARRASWTSGPGHTRTAR